MKTPTVESTITSKVCGVSPKNWNNIFFTVSQRFKFRSTIASYSYYPIRYAFASLLMFVGSNSKSQSLAWRLVHEREFALL